MANSPKYRDFFITINEGSNSYNNTEERIQECNYKLYGLIVHDKDIAIVQDENTGEFIEKPKAIHKHIMIELKNPISFESMQKRFPGAHIEIPKYKKSAYQYLIHNSPNSKDTKYQYDFNEIISNSPRELKFIIESETYELFKENMFLEYIADGTRTPYQFTKRFGLNAYKQYYKPYKDMIDQLVRDTEMQQDIERILTDRASNDDELPF